MSESLQIGLISAIEHLICLEPQVRNLTEGMDQHLRPFVDFSIARSATMGAAKSVWSLAPDSSDGPDGRVRRLLSVELHELKGKIEFLERETFRKGSDEQTLIQETIDMFTARRKEVSRRLGGNPTSTTRMISEAATYIDEQYWKAPPRSIIKGEWLFGSAIAHGHSWPAWSIRDTEVHSEVRTPEGERDRSVRAVVPTPKEFYRTLAVATCMTEIGLHLWNKRAEAPAS